MNAAAHYSNEIAKLSRGVRLTCNGYESTVVKVCDGQLAGMVEMRTPGGVVCVGIGDLKLENAAFFAA